MAECQVADTTNLIQRERKERESERRVLTDTLTSSQHDNKDLAAKVTALNSETTELKTLVEKASEAEQAASQLRTVWLTHCREESATNVGDISYEHDNGEDEDNQSDVHIVQAISRALFSGRQAASRLQATLSKLLESTSIVNLKNVESAKLQDSIRELNARLASAVSSGEAEVAALAR